MPANFINVDIDVDVFRLIIRVIYVMSVMYRCIIKILAMLQSPGFKQCR